MQVSTAGVVRTQYLPRSAQLVTLSVQDDFAVMEVVSIQEGVVRTLRVPVGDRYHEEGEPQAAEGDSTTANATEIMPSRSQFTPFRGDWRSFPSLSINPKRPHVAVHVVELQDGRVMCLDYTGRARILELRNYALEEDLQEWAVVVGTPANLLDVALLVDGEEQRDENNKVLQGNGQGNKGEGEGSGRGNGQGSGQGSGQGNGSGGRGKGPAATRGQRGNPNPGELPFPVDRFQELQDRVGEALTGRARVQVLEEERSPEVLAQVRAAKEAAWRRLLQKMDMDEGDMRKYTAYKDMVMSDVRRLRGVLQSVEARKNERSWLVSRDSGELDDNRLVEGLTGSRNVYKSRGETPPEPGSFQQLPKRIHFLFDLSMSMSRYSWDGRLQRSLETAVMVMESFRGFEHKFVYKIGGHSGDSAALEFVKEGIPPSTDRQRLQVIRKMHAHAELCDSGDSSLEAVRLAVQEIVKEEADDYTVFLLSDANLEQYNIGAVQLLELLRLDTRVRVYIIFIGSLGDQAANLVQQLPAGCVFAALSTVDIPGIVKACLSSLV